jgi:hypothetical protein
MVCRDTGPAAAWTADMPRHSKNHSLSAADQASSHPKTCKKQSLEQRLVEPAGGPPHEPAPLVLAKTRVSASSQLGAQLWLEGAWAPCHAMMRCVDDKLTQGTHP